MLKMYLAVALLMCAVALGAFPAVASALDPAVVPSAGGSVEFGAIGTTPISWTVESVSGEAGSYSAVLRTPLSAYDAGSDPNAWVTSISGFAANFTTAEYAALKKASFAPADEAPAFQRLNIDGADIVVTVDAGVLASGIASPSGPHGDYTTTTNKCAVCHSAHQAAASPTGEDWKLLSTSVADSCTYCHIDINQRSTMKVYDGLASNYNELPSQDATVVTSAHRTNIVNGIQYGAACSDCHSVHASATAMTGNAVLDASILRRPASFDQAQLDALAAETNADAALSTWCLGCHNIPSQPHHDTHVITASVSTTGTAQYAVDGCISCHGAGSDSSAFPHFVEGSESFLLSSPGPDPVPFEQAVLAPSATQDGVCLRCHSL